MPLQSSTLSPTKNRRPSGPRQPPLRSSTASIASSPKSTSDAPISIVSSITPITKLEYGTESSLDALLSLESQYTVSPEISPKLPEAAGPSRQVSEYEPLPPSTFHTRPPTRGHTQVDQSAPSCRETSERHSKSGPDTRDALPMPTFSIASRPSTPTSSATRMSKPRPKPSRLNTNVVSSSSLTSPTKMVSPGIKHWQQVRAHVMAPTPIEEWQHTTRLGKKPGLVSKAAGRFRFRHAADNIIGYTDRRKSMNGLLAELGDLTEEEKEAIVRERRKFARDIKACLDACALEESRRRLYRLDSNQNPNYLKDARPNAASIHSAAIHAHPHAVQRFTFDPSFSAFAPLLTELHKYLPDARSKKPWSRTCPHHSEILAELGVAFLEDSTSTDGEKQQALEVFGTIVKNWAADTSEEVMARWQWLCRALLTDDRQVRSRGLALLDSFVHFDSSLPRGHEDPHTALSFLALASNLLILLHAVQTARYPQPSHQSKVQSFLDELSDGRIIQVEAASIVELVGVIELSTTAGGIEKEIMWMAIGTVIQTHPHLARWLLETSDHGEQLVLDFAPPPLLHATPPYLPPLRSHTTAVLLTSLTSLVRTLTDFALIPAIWKIVRIHVLPEIETLPSGDVLAQAFGKLVFELEVLFYRVQPLHPGTAGDSSRTYAEPHSANAGPAFFEHRDLILRYTVDETPWKGPFVEAARHVIRGASFGPACDMVEGFVRRKDMATLGRECVATLFSQRLTSTYSTQLAFPLLSYLSQFHPQILYKPLFALSASTQENTLLPSLLQVTAFTDILSPSRFWLTDPQMVTIVLMGDARPKVSKGKGKEGEKSVRDIRLGRWAVAVEFILAFKEISEVEGKNSDEKKWKAFGDELEGRLAAFLEAEEKDGALPAGYRALICQVLWTLRFKTQSAKRAPWTKQLVSWFIDTSRYIIPSEEEQATKYLRAMYSTFFPEIIPSDQSIGQPIVLPFSTPHTSANFNHEARIEILTRGIEEVLPSLLVLAHDSLSTQDWETILPFLWAWYGTKASATREIGFLLEKCAEMIPAQLRSIIISDLTSTNAEVRCQALHNIFALFAWRNQILSQPILTSRRGPLFHFPNKTLEFVPTEIGSSEWVSPQDVQDTQLQKFGQTLPLELRQRLNELGWSDEDELKGNSDWEQTPVSSLPGLAFQSDGNLINGDTSGRPSSPMRSLVRKGSSASAGSSSNKKRKAIFAPLFVNMTYDQMTILAGEVDGPISATSLEVVRLLQRDDVISFLRPFTERMKNQFLNAMERLDRVTNFLTPGFAYSAINAIVGYLKTSLKTNADVEYWDIALASVVRLVSSVSEISLRDIRKNKAEHVLLPASIHEEDGGFKIHAPWRRGQRGVQTAQLLILNEILKANPREVYLVKKMLHSLPIQSSINHLPFARAWLVLVLTLFSFVNRNYNDRAELRQFLSNVGAILLLHGQSDLVIVAHAMRIFSLCSARFRRVFSSMGFPTIMRPVYETYAAGNAAIKDSIEYAAKSFYRIHEEVFVYQTCVVIADGGYDAKAVYALLSSLSHENTVSSGMTSGIRGSNDKEETDALVQMVSGPEITFAEIGKEAAERQAIKLASITLEDKLFPKENIVRLFVTAIASNPATTCAANFLRLLSALVPKMNDPVSKDLLSEGVEALGSVIIKGKTGDEAAKSAFHPGADDSEADWTRARREYVFLVESFAKAGGHLGTSTTRRTLDMVLDLLKKQPESVGPSASSIVGELAKTRLASGRPTPFLREIAPIFRAFISVVDFSGVLDSISVLIRQSNYNLDEEITHIIVHDYVEPAVKLLASASKDSLAFIVPLRSSAVKLLSVTVFLQGDALGALERHHASANLLASVVMPLCLLLEPPREIDRQDIYSSLWIRLLQYVLKGPIEEGDHNPKSSSASVYHPRSIAASTVLVVQIVKIVLIRAPGSISRVKGLWAYVAQRILQIVDGGNARFMDSQRSLSPRVVDWLMWSVFELVALHPSALHIEFQARIHQALAMINKQATYTSHPSSPALDPTLSPSTSPQYYPVRTRLSSNRSSSFIGHARSSSNVGLDHTPFASPDRLTTANLAVTPSRNRINSNISSPSHSPSPLSSPLVRPHGVGPEVEVIHSRSPSQGKIAGLSPAGAARPSFVALSARRASRPVFEAFSSAYPTKNRFPSSASITDLDNSSEKAGGAVMHLLGAPNQVLSATSSGFPTLSLTNSSAVSPTRLKISTQNGERALRDVYVKSEELTQMASNAVRTVMLVYGWRFNNEEEDAVRNWSVLDALHIVSKQTKVFVEDEFRDIFSPAAGLYESGDDHIGSEKQEGVGDLRNRMRASENPEKTSVEKTRRLMDEKENDVPIVSVSSPYD
ncbi:hypothetical protein CKF44_01613 [Cryptococcus neoformans]|nr:hypothetical protein CKF44_01613 [Cryptococcus neoformans var. grubii]